MVSDGSWSPHVCLVSNACSTVLLEIVLRADRSSNTAL
jgi:hypothetical protein